MKYTTLKEDIINILHSSDFNLDLKFYDENGNTTINVDDASWGYIHNENMIIEFMTDENPTIVIWKDKTNINNNTLPPTTSISFIINFFKSSLFLPFELVDSSSISSSKSKLLIPFVASII